MYDDSLVTPLLESAARGSESAWREIVDRYSSLVFAVCHQYRITGADADDVCGSVWLRLVAGLKTIRQPEALAGWLRTTARRECLTLLRHRNRQLPVGSTPTDEPVEIQLDEGLMCEERAAAVHEALAALPRRDQELLSMLFSNPPRSYQEISSALGVPIGAIGPARARCLTKARRTAAIAGLLDGAA